MICFLNSVLYPECCNLLFISVACFAVIDQSSKGLHLRTTPSISEVSMLRLDFILMAESAWMTALLAISFE